MDLILDTHTFLWFIDGNHEISTIVKNKITNPKTVKYISIASIWEIAIKLNIGKLHLDFDFEKIGEIIYQNGFEILDLSLNHILDLTNLENHHKDPFDRIIISQAKTEKLGIITKDSNFKYYKVKTIW